MMHFIAEALIHPRLPSAPGKVFTVTFGHCRDWGTVTARGTEEKSFNQEQVAHTSESRKNKKGTGSRQE